MIPAWALALPTLAAVLFLLAYVSERQAAQGLERRSVELSKIKRARSRATAKGNRTRAAKRKALQDSTTEKLKS